MKKLYCAAALTALAMTGCGGGGDDGLTRVLVTVQSTGNPIANIMQLDVTIDPGGQNLKVPEAPEEIDLPSTFSLAFPETASGPRTITVVARDGSGNQLATKSAMVTLDPGNTVPLTIEYGTAMPDGGVVDDGGMILDAGPDAVPIDAPMVDDGGGFFVTTAMPTNGAIDADPSLLISLAFNRNIDPTSAVAANVSLMRGGSAAPVTVSSMANNLFIRGTVPLVLLARHILTVSGIRSTDGAVMTMAHTLTFTTRDGIFSARAPISFTATGTIQNVNVAVAPGGEAVATWSNNGAGSFDILANQMTSAGVWANTSPAIEGFAGDAYGGDTTIAGTRAIAAWQNFNASRGDIYSNGTPLATPFQQPQARLIESNDVGTAQPPVIAGDSLGRAVVVWQHATATITPFTYHIFFNRYDGAAWGTAQPLFSTGNSVGQVIAAADDGTTYAAWSTQDAGTTRVRGARMAPAGGWSAAVTIGGTLSGSVSVPLSMAVDSRTGTAYLLMAVGDSIQLYSSTTGVTWLGPTGIHTIVGLVARNADIGVGPNGDVMMLFSIGSTQFWSRMQPGGAATAAMPLMGTTAASSQRPDVAVDAFGNAVATWQQVVGGAGDIWVARFDRAGNSWRAISNMGPGSGPELGMDASGRAVVTWQGSSVMSSTFR